MAAPLSIDQILSILDTTPERIANSTRGLSAAQVNASPQPGEWSINENLAHLRGYADTRGDHRILTMIREENPTIRSIHPNAQARDAGYRALNFDESLREFALQRQELIVHLAALSEADWSRCATIVGGGKPVVRTVWRSADGMARHERAHVRHIAKLAAIALNVGHE